MTGLVVRFEKVYVSLQQIPLCVNMNGNRRTFLQKTLMTGGLIGLLEATASEPAFAQQLLFSQMRGRRRLGT